MPVGHRRSRPRPRRRRSVRDHRHRSGARARARAARRRRGADRRSAPCCSARIAAALPPGACARRPQRAPVLLAGACVAVYQATFFAALAETRASPSAPSSRSARRPPSPACWPGPSPASGRSWRWAAATALACARRVPCWCSAAAAAGVGLDARGRRWRSCRAPGYAGYAVASKRMLDDRRGARGRHGGRLRHRRPAAAAGLRAGARGRACSPRRRRARPLPRRDTDRARLRAVRARPRAASARGRPPRSRSRSR